MPVYSSKSRQSAYDTLLRERKGRRITAEVFQRKKAIIDRREAKSVAYFEDRRERKAREAEARREAKKAVTRARREAVKAEKKAVRGIPANLLQFSVVVTDDIEDAVREMWKRTKGTTVRILWRHLELGDQNVAVTVAGKDAGYKKFRTEFLVEGESGGEWLINEGNKVLVMMPNDIAPKKLFQRFREGINHCVFTPIIARLQTDDGSASYIKKQAQRLLEATQSVACTSSR